jgi:CDP-diacylglycerol--serine O-phosphatidyltransferase
VRWLGRISAADLLTASNGVLGVLAITYILDGRHVIATLLLFLAVLVDGLDGFVARRYGSPHDFGRFLDSISDAVSFCLAPALIIYNNFYDKALGSAWVSLPNAVAVIVCLFYASFGILRLARFAGKDYSRNQFLGLPTPAASIVVLALCMLWGNTDLNPLAAEEQASIVLLATIALSLLMVSNVPYPKIKGSLAAVSGAVILLASVPLIWLLCLEDHVDIPCRGIELAALVLMFAYVLIGPMLAHHQRRMKRLGGKA